MKRKYHRLHPKFNVRVLIYYGDKWIFATRRAIVEFGHEYITDNGTMITIEKPVEWKHEPKAPRYKQNKAVMAKTKI